MQRREFLMGATGLMAMFSSFSGQSVADFQPSDADILGYLRTIKPSRQRVDDFILGRFGPRNLKPGEVFQFDSELGWVHHAAIGEDGVDGSKVIYSYEPDGARRVVNFSDRPCRIHTFGNSFTHCSQANDNETWEEYLAAHLGEPVRNYGVGGFGVYQAYRRMMRVERRTPGEYLVLNIWDDDHYRNLDAWRSIRLGPGSRCGFTLPHLRVDVAADRCEPRENLLQSAQDLYLLCDEDYILKAFRDDPVLRLVMATRALGGTRDLSRPVSVAFGIPDEPIAGREGTERIRQIHTQAALFATRKVVEWAQDFAASDGRKLLIMLSFGKENIARYLAGKGRFDRSFVDWLKTRDLPVVDMCSAFADDYSRFKISIEEYLEPFYNGHHTPKGNFFTAWVLKKSLLNWLDPRPFTYR